ncbi:MAG: hypothetical protein D6744_05680 [Planctomycetota bacterium]|nr:MAG: hypothetical protein D6744_05680 [Planctomycetota bacterium]
MNPLERLEDDRLTIFLFHGVIRGGTWRVRNYTHKHLPREMFAAVLRGLTAAGSPMSMEQALWHVTNHEPFPPRSFAITFDDGFENNLSVAAPILADFQCPATFYLTTDFIERNAMSWIDRLEACFERAATVRVRLPWLDEPVHAHAPAERIGLLEAIRTHVKQTRDIDRDAFVADVCAQCGVVEQTSGDGPLDKKLSWAQVRRLAADRLFTIGGHTHTHATLSFLDDDALASELDASLRLLGERGGVAPRHYSYPEGLTGDFDDRVIAALKSRGIRCCPTAIDGTNACDADPFRLHRVTIAPPHAYARPYQPALIGSMR